MERKESRQRQKKSASQTGAGILALVGDTGREGEELTLVELKTYVVEATTESLRSELARLLGFSADNLVRLAIIVQELEKRGEDLKSIRFGLLPILRLIAIGKLLPEIVVLYAGEPAMMKRISNLPIGDQQQIAAGVKPAPEEPKQLNGATDKFSPPKPRGHTIPRQPCEDPNIGECKMPNLKSIAESANPKDVAEMAASLILNSQRRDDVFRELLQMLKSKMSGKSVDAIRVALLALSGK